jgi:hypothetical protein
MIYPTTLDPEELEQVIDRVTALSGKELGAARICRLLAESHSVLTSKVNQDCAVGNISDVVSNAINPRIVDLGLYISCMKPPKPIPNRFNQPSGMHLWSFYRDTAANDPEHHQEHFQNALRGDSSALQQQGQAMAALAPFDPVKEFDAVLSGLDQDFTIDLDLDFTIDLDLDFTIEPLNLEPLPGIDLEGGHHAGR